MAFHDMPYLSLIEDVLANGVEKTDRTGTGTISVFVRQMRFDLSDGTIPLLTTKKMHTRSILRELLWYLRGTGNIQYLKDNNVTIWNEWANETGDLGPVYGVQWRNWPTFEQTGQQMINDGPEYGRMLQLGFTGKIDQIADLINDLKTNPDGRRLLVSAWNVGQLKEMALPPCHYSFQFYTTPNKNGTRSLSCLLNQRSCDVGLGVPFNIVQYSILTRMIAEVVDMTPGELVWVGGDVHIYKNHMSALKEQVYRDPFPSPKLEFARSVNNIDDFKFEDFVITDYQSHPTIKMEVSV